MFIPSESQMYWVYQFLHILRSKNMSTSSLSEWVLEVLRIQLSASGLFLSHLDQEGHWDFLCFWVQFIYGYWLQVMGVKHFPHSSVMVPEGIISGRHPCHRHHIDCHDRGLAFSLHHYMEHACRIARKDKSWILTMDSSPIFRVLPLIHMNTQRLNGKKLFSEISV